MYTLRHYIPFSGFKQGKEEEQEKKINALISNYHLRGTEIYPQECVTKTQLLYQNQEEKTALIHAFRRAKAKRLHHTYWAEPSDFLARIDYAGLLKRFGSEAEVAKHYGDTTGDHVYSRWIQEYEIAREMKMDAVTFHLIDYFHIDGVWEFTISPKDVLKGMVIMTNTYLRKLDEAGILADGPIIELENAGFGLEYGVQTAEDYAYILNNVEDIYNKLRIGWEINHLLHAVGFDNNTQRARFFLTDQEMTEEKKQLEREYGDNPTAFSEKWVEQNVLHPLLKGKITAIHVSDCELKQEEVFRNGILTGKYLQKIKSLPTEEEQADYGVEVLLKYYDSHVPLGATLKNLSKTIMHLLEQEQNLSLFHELKNQELDESVLKEQFVNLFSGEEGRQLKNIEPQV